ncbi:MAG: hypothetical protein RIC87_12460 [Kiloniellales bacterium]
MTRRPAGELRDPFTTPFEASLKFFTASDIDEIFDKVGMERPAGLHESDQGGWQPSLAERAAKSLHNGLLAFVSQTRRREVSPNGAINTWAHKLRGQTDRLLIELGFDLATTTRPKAYDTWVLGDESRLGLFGEVALRREQEILLSAGESLAAVFGRHEDSVPEMLEDPMLLRPWGQRPRRIPLGLRSEDRSGKIDFENVESLAHAVVILNIMAREMEAFYASEEGGKSGPKGTVRYFTFAAMDAYEMLTGERARIHIVPQRKEANIGREYDLGGHRYGDALDFVQCALDVAAERLEDGSVEEAGVPMELSIFRSWLVRTAKMTKNGPPLEPHFREFNASKGREIESG